MIAAELPQILDQTLRLLRLVHDPGHGSHQPIALVVHHRREHVAQRGVLEEEQRVEVAGDLVGPVFHQREGLLDQPWIE